MGGGGVTGGPWGGTAWGKVGGHLSAKGEEGPNKGTIPVTKLIKRKLGKNGLDNELQKRKTQPCEVGGESGRKNQNDFHGGGRGRKTRWGFGKKRRPCLKERG